MEKPLVIARPLHRGTSLRLWRCEHELRGASTAHRGLELTWITAGRAHYRSGSRAFSAGPGELAVVPAGMEHETTLEAGVEGNVIELSQPLMDEIAAATSLAGRRFDGAALLTGGEDVLPLAQALERESRVSGPGHELVVDALLEALIVRLLRLAVVPESGKCVRDARILAAMDFVEAHLQDVIGVDDMAKAAAMSRFHFSRRFREVSGVSPHAFLLEARARRSAALLRRGQRSVTEAAFAAGFQDLGRFRAAFRRTYGVSPGQYAQQQAARAKVA
jgi:AraC family transcriptional regulator